MQFRIQKSLLCICEMQRDSAKRNCLANFVSGENFFNCPALNVYGSVSVISEIEILELIPFFKCFIHSWMLSVFCVVIVNIVYIFLSHHPDYQISRSPYQMAYLNKCELVPKYCLKTLIMFAPLLKDNVAMMVMCWNIQNDSIWNVNFTLKKVKSILRLFAYVI